MKYNSQCRQDRFVDTVIYNQKENGFFLEIGAYDGKTLSNTLFFEEHRNWKGICIEPIPSAFEKLKKNRKCECINGCIAAQDGFVEFLHVDGASEMLSGMVDKYNPIHCERIDKELKELGGEKKYFKVASYNLNNILSQRNIPEIDFCSIDIEGGELDLVKSIDFSKIKINCLSIENNYNDSQISDFMIAQGYDLVGKLESDEIFILKGNPKLEQFRKAVKSHNFKSRARNYIKRKFNI